MWAAPYCNCGINHGVMVFGTNDKSSNLLNRDVTKLAPIKRLANDIVNLPSIETLLMV